ncbi:MAG: type II toxin-antitoxin system MqsA family antitoxin [Mesorhizobium sp.]|nr:type II toxin-antitoxin system MqsA family antitoxin [Mesorhizobium sp.]
MTSLEIEIGLAPRVEHECPQCGSTRLRESLVKSAFWQDDRLVVVEDIPAVICEACGERFYDDATVTALDLMHGDGFPAGDAASHMHVPVFSFSHRIPAELVQLAEAEE